MKYSALRIAALPWVFVGSRYYRISVEFTTGSDDRIRELSAKLLRSENPSVIMAVAEQLKIAIDTFVREHTFHILAIKEITSR